MVDSFRLLNLFIRITIVSFCIFCVYPSFAEGERTLEWQTLPSLPDEHGFAGGFSGTLNGSANGLMIFAGGANFPAGYPWDGGKKYWYDDIYTFDGEDEWQHSGKLPQSMAYGLSVSYRNSAYFLGGNNASGDVFDTFYKLDFFDGKLKIKELPTLPQKVANPCGTVINGILYVAGGTDGKHTLNNFWSFNLEQENSEWNILDSWPGPSRMLAVAGSLGGDFYLLGGAELVSNQKEGLRNYLGDAYRYTVGESWQRLVDMPTVRAAAPSPALEAEGLDELLVLAGSDGSLDGQMEKLHVNHPGFPSDIFVYDAETGEWSIQSVMPKIRGHRTPTGRDGVWPPVTTNVVEWRDGVAIPSGEIKPGVRTPAVLFVKLSQND